MAKDDEDEGSPTRVGATPTDVGGKSTDQRKPSGCATTRPPFPPKQTLLQRRVGNPADKMHGVACQ